MANPLLYIAAIALPVCATLFLYFYQRSQEQSHQLHYHYRDSNKTFVDEGNLCTICREDVKSELEKRYLKCGHVFHSACISRWEYAGNPCPNCRAQ